MFLEGSAKTTHTEKKGNLKWLFIEAEEKINIGESIKTKSKQGIKKKTIESEWLFNFIFGQTNLRRRENWGTKSTEKYCKVNQPDVVTVKR